MTTPATRNFEDIDQLNQVASVDGELLVVQGGQVYRVTISNLPQPQQQSIGAFIRSVSVSGNTLTITAVAANGQVSTITFTSVGTGGGGLSIAEIGAALSGVPVSVSGSNIVLSAHSRGFGGYWVSAGGAAISALPANAFAAAGTGGTKLGNNTAWSAANVRSIVLHDVSSSADGTGAGPDLSEPLSYIQNGAMLYVENQNSDQYGWAILMTNGAATQGSNRTTIPCQFILAGGSHPPTNGALVKININPNNFEVSPSSIIRLFEWLTANLTTEFADAVGDEILPEPEHTTQTGWRWRGITEGLNFATVPNANDIGEVNPGQLWANPSNANLVDVERFAKKDHTFTVRKDANNFITYRVNQKNRNVGSGNQRYFAYTKETVGTLALNDTVSLELTPPFVTVDRVDDEIDSPPSPINLPTSKAVADYADAGDETAHEHIDLLAQVLEEFYKGWTSVSGANYSVPATIVANLPVDAYSNDDQVAPSTSTPVILRGSTWSDAPGNAIWGLDFISGTPAVRYFLGINAGGADQFVYRRNGSDWNKLWEDGVYESGAASDPVFLDHWFDAVDGDIRLADALETRRHQWSIPGVSASLMGLYRREGRDVAYVAPNYGGSAIVDYSWNRFKIDAADIDVDASGFSGNLSSTDTTVQEALKTINEFSIHPAQLGSDLSGIGSSFVNIATGLADTDIISVSGRAQWTTETGNWYYFDFGPRLFGKIVTTDDTWVTLRGSGSGQRLHLRRNGTNLQLRIASAVQNVTGEVYRWN